MDDPDPDDLRERLERIRDETTLVAVEVSCARCGAQLGRLSRDGRVVELLNPGECPHHPGGLDLDAQQVIWRAQTEPDPAEVIRLAQQHDLATLRVP